MTIISSAVSVLVAEFVPHTLALWNAAGSSFPRLGRRYTAKEQERRELLLDESIERIDREFRDVQRSGAKSERVLACVTAAMVEMATCALDFRDSYVKHLLRDGFSQVGVDFGKWARQLDPSISFPDLLQACRNAWVACGLQVLLGGEMRLTPAIFGYSMLYPYSDNYLDDPTISAESKCQFNARFRRRLEGEWPVPLNQREEMIWYLVGLIESEYSRATYSEVYDSLLAIHKAQQESIQQMGGLDFDALELTVTKGGTSVLADAFLARGTLAEAEARFAFEWGVVLQIGDDLQDVQPDQRRGSTTLFSRMAGREPLDDVTNQTFQFGELVMSRMSELPTYNETLTELLARSFRALLMRSIANMPELYSNSHLEELETYSPYRFAFLRDRERQFSNRSRSYIKRLDTLLYSTANSAR